MSFIVSYIGRHVVLRTYKHLVDCLDTGNPVTVHHFTISLDIILTAGEVPHKVTPVHEVQLIGKEVTQVFGKRRLHHRHVLTATVELHRFSLELRPFLISSHMRIHIAVHTWEKHIQFVYIFIFHIVARNKIFVFFTRIFLDDAAPYSFTFLGYRSAVTALVLALYFRSKRLSVQQRCFTILFTSQIRTQSENIARSILVHRRIGRRTDHRQCIRRITDNDHHQANQYGIQHLDIHLLAHKQISSQGTCQNNRQHIAASDKRHTHQYDRQNKRHLHAHRINFIAHRFPDRPDQHGGQYNHIGKYT